VVRLGLSVVTPPSSLRSLSPEAARELDAVGGGQALLRTLSDSGVTLGDMGSLLRTGLIISLDELAEAEALETEWREAEELASIMDGELTRVPGFKRFRREVLEMDE
jgi:hypothetical protein